MATEKVGIYRKYHGKIPKDKSGQPLPKSDWPKKRAFRWAVRWFGTNGKRYSKSFKTRKEADRHAKEIQVKVEKGKPDKPKRITLGSFKSEHERIMRNQIAHKTLMDHVRALKVLVDYIGSDISLVHIKARHAESFVAERLAKGLAVGTVNKDIRTLKGIFNLAIEPRGYLAEGTNPFAKIRQRRFAPKPPNYVSKVDFKQLFSVADTALWKALLAIAYTSGAREDELLNLTWSDVDFQKNQLHITRKDKHNWVQAWQPKDHELRTIPLPEQTVNLLTAWQSVAPDNSPYVFMEHGRWDYYRLRVAQGKWRAEQSLVNNVLRRFKTLCRKAKVGPYTVHDLRRSCITNWARELPIHVVQKLAGHSDIRTTQKYYLSIQAGDIQRAQRVQSKVLGKILTNDLTDPKLTHLGQKRDFPGRKVFP
ncbi:MAG: tyrosine-type recombinase/integrase [Planctomycetota bacterium]|jgi:integrase